MRLSLGRNNRNNQVSQRFSWRSKLGLGGAIGASQLIMGLTGMLSARWLGPSGKGLVAAATTWTQVLGWIAGFGLGAAIQVRVARTRECDRASALATAAGNSLAYSFGIGGVVVLLAYLPLQRALGNLGDDTTFTVGLPLLMLPIAMFSSILGHLQIGLGRSRQYSTSISAGPIITLAVILVVHALADLTPAMLVMSYVPGSLVSLGISMRGLPWRRARVNLAQLGGDLSLGVKIWFSTAMDLANVRLDLLVMAVVLTASDVGLYSTANNLMMPIVALPAAIMQLAPTTTGNIDASHGRVESLRVLRGEVLMALAVAAMIGIGVALLAPVVVHMLLGQRYENSVVLAWILIPGFVCRSVTGVITAGANGLGLPGIGNLAQGAGLAITLAMLPIFLPAFGATGAAVTSTVSYTASALVASFWFIRKLSSSTTQDDISTEAVIARQIA